MKDIFQLDEEEQQIVETESKVRRIAQESQKRKNVNIRISERDLSQLRDRSTLR